MAQPAGSAVGAPAFTAEQDPLIYRPRQADDPDNRFFWASGEDGLLRISQCCDCTFYIHPATGHCPACGGDRCAPAVVSGRGRVHTFTINHQPWIPDQSPYIIVVVELDEQPGLRLTSNLFDCELSEAIIGQRVRVGFLSRHGVWYPIFVPDPEEHRGD